MNTVNFLLAEIRTTVKKGVVKKGVGFVSSTFPDGKS